MSEWREVKLGDICTFNYGKSLTSNIRKSGKIPVYSSAGITGWHNQSLVNSKGIIVGRKGSVGTVFYSESPFYCIDTAYYILPKDDLYNFKYLFYRLKSLGLANLNEDSAVPGLNRETAYSQTFLLPPLPEQKAIAETLSCLDDKIELNNKINANLEQTAQAIFKSWFVDFEPFQDGEFVESELGRIPKGWRVVEFEKISTVQNGFAFKSENYCSDGCHMIRTTNIDNGFVNNDSLIHLPSDFYTTEKYKSFKFENFDTVLVMVGASVGKIGLITEKNIPALQNQNMWRFRPLSKHISPVFIHYYVKLINEKVKNWSGGSARDFYRKDIYKKALCILPSQKEMVEFENLTLPLFQEMSKYLAENEKLSMIRNILLPKLMSGEIDVLSCN